MDERLGACVSLHQQSMLASIPSIHRDPSLALLYFLLLAASSSLLKSKGLFYNYYLMRSDLPYVVLSLSLPPPHPPRISQKRAHLFPQSYLPFCLFVVLSSSPCYFPPYPRGWDTGEHINHPCFPHVNRLLGLEINCPMLPYYMYTRAPTSNRLYRFHLGKEVVAADAFGLDFGACCTDNAIGCT